MSGLSTMSGNIAFIFLTGMSGKTRSSKNKPKGPDPAPEVGKGEAHFLPAGVKPWSRFFGTKVSVLRQGICRRSRCFASPAARSPLGGPVPFSSFTAREQSPERVSGGSGDRASSLWTFWEDPLVLPHPSFLWSHTASAVKTFSH